MVRVILGAVLGAVFLVQSQPLRARADEPARRDRIRAYLDEWRAGGTFPGAALGVAIRGADAFAVTTGVSDRATQRPVTPDDLFMAGSTGKTFFAAVAVQLIEAGVIDLDSPISRYLAREPWFSRLPNASQITVRHLMTHTSGLVRYEMNPKFTADLRAQPSKHWTPEAEIAYLLDATPPFAPGQGWDYSDTNYIVLGMIMERTTRTNLYDQVRERFLNRLLLTRIAPTTSRRIPGLVPGYAGARDPLGFPDEVMKDGELVISPQFEWTGGGYATSPLDLARWGSSSTRAVPSARRPAG